MLKQNRWSMVAAALCLLSGFAAAQKQSPTAIRNAVREYRQQHEVEIVRSFAQLLSLSNVAGDTANITRNADAISKMLELICSEKCNDQYKEEPRGLMLKPGI